MSTNDKQMRAQLQGMVAFLLKLYEEIAEHEGTRKPALPLNQLIMLLQVAANAPEDTPMLDLGKLLKTPGALTTRSAYALSDWSYLHRDGLGLLAVKENRMDRRFKLLGISPKGDKILKDACDAFNKKAEAAVRRQARQ